MESHKLGNLMNVTSQTGPRGRLLAIVGASLILLSSTSCSSHNSGSTISTEKLNAEQRRALHEDLSIDVFSARGFLGGSEYERYYLGDSILWRECGNIESERKAKKSKENLEGDQFLEGDQNLKIRERRVEQMPETAEQNLKLMALRLIDRIERDDNPTPPPGPFYSLADPGMIEIKIGLGSKRRILITSVDAVADKETAPLADMHSLFSVIRGVGPTICDSKTFFGISRSKI
jgi:hypothetical protein